MEALFMFLSNLDRNFCGLCDGLTSNDMLHLILLTELESAERCRCFRLIKNLGWLQHNVYKICVLHEA